MVEPTTVYVGIDWAHQFHDFCIGDRDVTGRFRNTPEEIDRFAQLLISKFPDRRIAICLEQTHGSLMYALQKYVQFTLYPINPGQLANFRKALQPGGKADDASDARLLKQLLEAHEGQLHVWKPQEPQLRELGALVEHRRRFVQTITKGIQQLQDALKMYFPLALTLLGDRLNSTMGFDFLMKWTSLKALKRANPEYVRKLFQHHGWRNPEQNQERLDSIRNAVHVTTDAGILEPNELLVRELIRQLRVLHQTVDKYDKQILAIAQKYEETELFSQIRGIGVQLAPRLVVAFGTDRDRFHCAAELQAYSGIAPVTKKSGKKNVVTRRYACPAFLRQTFHEMALQMKRYSLWSKAYYDMLVNRGNGHHAAIRALAFKWIRILFAIWKNRTVYDEEKYIQRLRHRNSPILHFLPKTTEATT